MNDRRADDHAPIHRDDGPFSTPAIISYIVLLLFLIVSVGVYVLIWFQKDIEDVMLTLVGAILTAVVGGLAGVTAYWLASSSGSKANSAAIRQLAGAGPPPPADPVTGATSPSDLPMPTEPYRPKPE
jgi:hypothetical protein